MKILIPNATSPKNIGDKAMLVVLLRELRLLYPQAEIVVHSSDPTLYTASDFAVRNTLYSWAVFTNRSFFPRIGRVLRLLFAYLTFSKRPPVLPPSGELGQLLDDYRSADAIVFTGGGYLRSQPGIKQSLNLIMLLLMFKFATRLPVPVKVAPISFGPFAHMWQERLAARVLSRAGAVVAREAISYQVLAGYGLAQLTESSDLAFLAEPETQFQRPLSAQPIVGFTVREWLRNPAAQAALEASIVAGLSRLAHTAGVTIQPIIQVDAPEMGDRDEIATRRIVSGLHQGGVEAMAPIKIKDEQDAFQVYSQLNLLLGMRMHSNILASVVGVPFVALSYEYKTEGIARQLGMEQYCLKVEDVTSQRLIAALEAAFAERTESRIMMQSRLKTITSEGLEQLRIFLAHH